MDGKTPFLTSLRASLTAETALVLPIFLICVLTVLWYGHIYYNSVRIGSALTETAEELAIGAYSKQFHEEDSLLGVALNIGYASGRVRNKTGGMPSVKNLSFLTSGILKEDDFIDLSVTYQAQAPFPSVSVPWLVFRQKGCVRGWTGRKGSSGKSEEGDGGQDMTPVYVTEHGIVYHLDKNCTHIHLSIQQVSKVEAEERRNENGEKYHACELCGKNAGGLVYITNEGNRYHSDKYCSGLKRTIRQVTKDDVGDLRPCSRCGHSHDG